MEKLYTNILDSKYQHGIIKMVFCMEKYSIVRIRRLQKMLLSGIEVASTHCITNSHEIQNLILESPKADVREKLILL